MERLSSDALSFLVQVPPVLAQSRDPVWRTCWLAIRALTRYDLKMPVLDALHREIVANALAMEPRLRLLGRSTAADLRLASVVLRTLIFMGASDAATKLTDAALEPAGKVSVDRPLSPVDELLFFEMFQTRTRLLLATLLTAEDRVQRHERQFEMWVYMRDRLLNHWPYDPRGESPAAAAGRLSEAMALHDELLFRLVEARTWVAICARRGEFKVPPEPRLARTDK